MEILTFITGIALGIMIKEDLDRNKQRKTNKKLLHELINKIEEIKGEIRNG